MHTSTTQYYSKNSIPNNCENNIICTWLSPQNRYINTYCIKVSLDPEIQRLPFAVSFVRFWVNRIWSDISICFHFISDISFAGKADRKLRTLKGISCNYKWQQSSYFKYSNLYLIPVKFWCEIIASVFVIQKCLDFWTTVNAAVNA